MFLKSSLGGGRSISPADSPVTQTRPYSRDAIVARLTSAIVPCVCIFAILLTARFLAGRIVFYDSIAIQRDLLPALTTLDVLGRWITEYRTPLLRGVLGDLVFSVIFAGFLAFLGPWPRRIALLLLAVFCAANIEHIKYNFENIDLRSLGFAVDPTFVRGSLTIDAVKYMLVLLVVWALAAILMRRSTLRTVAAWSVAGLLGLALVASPPPTSQAAMWMQTSPLLPQVRGQDIPVGQAHPEPGALASATVPDPVDSRYNLLVVYLEGLSLKSLDRGRMTTLQALAQDGISFDTYISRQIITANGLYATLTGDAPSLIQRMSKWDDMTKASAVVENALPSILARAGYRTSYLQAADLAFMDKDQHMATLGFADLRGNEDWTEAHGRNGWGVDDLTLMERTLAHIDDQPADATWFVSVLTSGTHSPYNVPGVAKPSRQQALQQADRSIAALLAGLRDRDLLDSTTVIITSDEGREVGFGAGFLNDLTLNRLPLIVLHPDVSNLRMSQPLMNTDLRNLAMTLTAPLDAATLQDSLPVHRDLVFGNIITGKVYWFDTVTRVLSGCRVPNFDCLSWTDRQSVFDTSGDPGPMTHLPMFEDLAVRHDDEVGLFRDDPD